MSNLGQQPQGNWGNIQNWDSFPMHNEMNNNQNWNQNENQNWNL